MARERRQMPPGSAGAGAETPRFLPASGGGSPETELFEWSQIWNYTRFVLGAPRRHPSLAAGMLALCLGSADAALYVLPKTYETEIQVLGERNLVMPALGNPSRTIPTEADAPMRAAPEAILKQDNLVALIQQLDLVQAWERSWSPLQRLRAWIWARLAPPLTEEEKVQGMVGVLEKRLTVTTSQTGAITIRVGWPDPKLASQIVEAAYRNFLESRHAAEVSAISEAISILERRAAQARQQMEAAAGGVRRARGRGRPAGASRPPSATAARPPGAAPDAHELAAQIAATHQAIEDLDSTRRRRVAELQGTLAELRSVFSPAHPSVLSAQQTLQSLSTESLQVVALRRRARQLEQDYQRRTGYPWSSESAAPAAALPRAEPGQVVVAADQPVDDTLELSRAQLQNHLARYEGLLSRIEAARIELDTARAAFKYRYSVLRPAAIPNKPSKPSVPLTLLGGLLAGALLAFASATALDLVHARIVEPWQVASLKLPVLGTLRGRD